MSDVDEVKTKNELLIVFELLGSTLFSFMGFSTIGNLFKTKIGINWEKIYPYNERLKSYSSRHDLRRRINYFNHSDTSLRIWNINLSIFVSQKIHKKHNIKKIIEKYNDKKMIKKSIIFIIFYGLFSYTYNDNVRLSLNDIAFRGISTIKSTSISEIRDINLIWSSDDESNESCKTVSKFINNSSYLNKNLNCIKYQTESVKFIESKTFKGITKKQNDKQYKFGIYNTNKNECKHILHKIFGNKFINIKHFYAAYINLKKGNWNLCAALIDIYNDKNKYNIKQIDDESNEYIIKEKVLVWTSKV